MCVCLTRMACACGLVRGSRETFLAVRYTHNTTQHTRHEKKQSHTNAHPHDTPIKCYGPLFCSMVCVRTCM